MRECTTYIRVHTYGAGRAAAAAGLNLARSLLPPPFPAIITHVCPARLRRRRLWRRRRTAVQSIRRHDGLLLRRRRREKETYSRASFLYIR